jgi:uncharacterized ion transporter superfamily protein YfcC
MAAIKKVPSPITILMVVIIIAAIATWLVPAGKYSTLSASDSSAFTVAAADGNNASLPFTQKILDSLQIRIPLEKFKTGAIRKPVSIPGTYQSLEKNGQGFFKIIQAPLKGIYDSIDIILFILVIGGFMNIFNQSGAMIRGLKSLSHTMKGREAWLIIILTFLFSFAGSSYGMAEETLVFYPVMVPLFLAAGYDLLVPVAVIFAGTQLGTLSSFSNPFSAIIASNAAGVNWVDGIYERILMFVISTAITTWYIVRYANKVKKDPSASIVFKVDGPVKSLYPSIEHTGNAVPTLNTKTKLLLLLFLATFLMMIGGVIFLEWWLLEMSALFLGSSLLLAIILKINEKDFITQFVSGAADLLSVAFIVGVARGVTIVLNDGNISDSILFYSTKLVGNMQPAVFILVLLGLYMMFTLFISSSSGMAVLTMPVIGALAIMVNVPGREIVNSYLFGMGIMGLILPSLALVNVSFKAWWRFIYPLLILLFILSAAFLIAGIYL